MLILLTAISAVSIIYAVLMTIQNFQLSEHIENLNARLKELQERYKGE